MLAEVVQMPAKRTVEDVLGDVYDTGPDIRQGTDLLVLRLPVEQQWDPDLFAGEMPPKVSGALVELLGGTDVAITFARVDDRPVHLLHSFRGRHLLSANVNPRFPHATFPADMPLNEAIEDIQAAELDHLLEKSRAVITAAPGTVFEAPSGRLVRHFIRVGNIQYSRDAVDALFYWLLPHLDRCAAILVDTWSISSVAFNISVLCQRYFGGGPRRVELLPDYIDPAHGSDLRAREVIERLVREAPTDPELDRILCLISATQSGSLRNTLGEIVMGGLDRFHAHYVAIFALGPTNMPALRELVHDQRFRLLQPAVDVGRPDHRIRIDRQVYFPLIFQDEPVEITQPVTVPSREVVDALAGHGILQVHRTITRNQSARHHGVHVATEHLAALPWLRDRITKALAAIQKRPVRLVAPPGSGSEQLVALVNEQLRNQGVEAPTLLHPTLHFAANASEAELKARAAIRGAGEDDEIIVLVDAWVNDASLSQYQRSLRTEGFAGRIWYLIGVACPSSPKAWERTRRRLRHRGRLPPHEVITILELPLPDWRDQDCPWCQELALYNRWARRGPLHPRLANRTEALGSAAALGMSDDLFLALPARTPLALGPSSFFVDQGSSQADAFAAVSSALQRLRSRDPAHGPPLGPRRFPVSTVLKHGDYLKETWTDSILRSIFLRGAHPEELVYADPSTEAERTTDLRDLLLDPSPAQHDIAIEILLATALGKATVHLNADLRHGLAAIDEDGTIRFFLDMIEKDAAEEAARAVGGALAGGEAATETDETNGEIGFDDPDTVAVGPAEE
ncbi:hypothetical protein E5A73_06110 [Sphingomonas gei]|uniref:Uncharacterized protein n=1 Tax=Sphingomonas gei TaxID=1395960 RepID=A0A4S1XH40_9SPHN|nr:hypothetical protein [Sphingomonas gei]TGX55010.1 hypothetical protein E5A73_06110 [Sphingomonas gei]